MGCSWACTRIWVLKTACYVLAATTAKASEKAQPKTFISCSAVARHTKNTKLQLSARKSRIHQITCPIAIVIAQLKLSSFSEKNLVNDFEFLQTRDVRRILTWELDDNTRLTSHILGGHNTCCNSHLLMTPPVPYPHICLLQDGEWSKLVNKKRWQK
jgi:hypothetical protein